MFVHIATTFFMYLLYNGVHHLKTKSINEKQLPYDNLRDAYKYTSSVYRFYILWNRFYASVKCG